MGLGQIGMRIRVWWYLLIAGNATIPPDLGPNLIALRDRNRMAIEKIEQKRRAIIDQGAAQGKSISTERALNSVLELRKAYDGPNREEYVAEIDRFVDDFRKQHGPQIPVDEAYAIVKDIEARFGRDE